MKRRDQESMPELGPDSNGSEAGSSLAADEELYGRLLWANERIERTGGSLVWPLFGMALALCVALHMHWLDSLLGLDLASLRGWGVYALIFVLSFVFYTVYTDHLEKVEYLAVKPALRDYIRHRDLSPHVLFAKIESDENLGYLVEQMAADNELQA